MEIEEETALYLLLRTISLNRNTFALIFPSSVPLIPPLFSIRVDANVVKSFPAQRRAISIPL